MIPARRRVAAVLLATIGLLATPWGGARAATPSPSPSISPSSAGTGSAKGLIGSAVPSGSDDKRQLKVDFSASKLVDGTATAQSIATGGATVTVQPDGGQPTSHPAEVSLASAEQQTRTVMLALDISGSMQNKDKVTGQDKLTAEKAAALAFVDTLPFGTRIGIVTFKSPAKLLQPPTTSRALVREQIDGLPRNKNEHTGLYQAINLAAGQLNTQEAKAGQRLLVMVTDGNDSPGAESTSTTSSAEDKAAARKAIAANTFLFRGVVIGASDQSDLRDVAPGGDVLTDTVGSGVTEKLAKVFASGNDALNKEATLTVGLDPKLSGPATVSVQARTSSGEFVTDKYRTVLIRDTSPAKATVPVETVGRPSWINRPVMLAALLAVFIAVTVLLTGATGAFGGGDKDAETPVSRALSFYSVRAGRPERLAATEQPRSRSGSRMARTAINAINRVARQRKLDQALDTRLEAAGLPIRTAEWSLLHIGSGIAGGLLLLVASRGTVVGAILGLAIGLAGPWLFLALRKSRRESKFLAQLPDTLQLLAGSLAAGYSLPQAMDAVLRESQSPIRDEFNRALVESRLGMAPEDALDGIAARTGSRDFSWIVMAIRIQRGVGGNLAELLSTVAETLRERERLRRQVKALSAEGRLSGTILGALPLVFALFLIFTKPAYIAPLFQTPIGWLMLAVGSVLLVVGSIWMAKTVTVEV